MPRKNADLLLRDRTHVRSFSGVIAASAMSKRKAKYLESQYLALLANAGRLRREFERLEKEHPARAREKARKLTVVASRMGAIADELRKQNRSIQG